MRRADGNDAPKMGLIVELLRVGGPQEMLLAAEAVRVRRGFGGEKTFGPGVLRFGAVMGRLAPLDWWSAGKQ